MNKITPKDQEPKVEETKVEEPKVEELKMADTIAPAVENGSVAIDPTLDEAELKKVEETADTVKLEMPDGEQVDVNKTELEKPEEITLQPMADEACTCETEDRCADYISRTKILDVIESTMARYKGKVVLAMEEVRDIIKAITTAVKE